MVNTVTGPVAADRLGKTLMHEHFVFGYPGFAGDVTMGAFNREEALKIGLQVAEKVMSHGVQTVVDATTNEAGRNPELLKEISEKTGLNIICSTGYYYEGEGAPAYFKFRNFQGKGGESQVHEMFSREIAKGIGKTGIKPGVIKLASSKGVITPYELMFFKAAAQVQKETGITLITHTQEATMGPEQADLLIAEGADPSRIMIGHMCGSTDIGYHQRTLAKGVYIAFDRFGIQGIVGAPMDDVRKALAVALIKLGYAGKLMFSHDSVNYMIGRPLEFPPAVAKLMENAQPCHIFENIIPDLLAMGVSESQIVTIMVENPMRLFGAANF